MRPHLHHPTASPRARERCEMTPDNLRQRHASSARSPAAPPAPAPAPGGTAGGAPPRSLLVAYTLWALPLLLPPAGLLGLHTTSTSAATYTRRCTCSPSAASASAGCATACGWVRTSGRPRHAARRGSSSAGGASSTPGQVWRGWVVRVRSRVRARARVSVRVTGKARARVRAIGLGLR